MKHLLITLLFLVLCFPCFSQTRPSYYQLKDMPFTDLKAVGAKGNGTTKFHNVTTLTRVEGVGVANVQGFTQSGTSYFGAVFP